MKAGQARSRSLPEVAPKQAIHDIAASDATEALRRGPRGALIIAAIAVGILFLGWMLFYFVLFMRRGYVG
jgi:hypothetical protein